MLYYELIDLSQQITCQAFHIVRSFLKATVRTQIGWHYITDLMWLYSHIKHWPKSISILDAGEGTGPLQFLLAEMGYNITNVDMNFQKPPPLLRDRYQTILNQLKESDTSESMDFFNYNQQYGQFFGLKRIVKKFKERVQENCLLILFYRFRHNRWRQHFGLSSSQVGKISWKVGNLCNLNGIPSKSFDAVVSLSALEHIPMEHLGNALNEIRRVLKDQCYCAITTSATDQMSTWYHQPSLGYCYTVADVEKFFQVKSIYPQDPKRIRQKYKKLPLLKRTSCKILFIIRQLRYAIRNMGSKIYTGWDLPMIHFSKASVTSGII